MDSFRRDVTVSQENTVWTNNLELSEEKNTEARYLLACSGENGAPDLTLEILPIRDLVLLSLVSPIHHHNVNVYQV